MTDPDATPVVDQPLPRRSGPSFPILSRRGGVWCDHAGCTNPPARGMVLPGDDFMTFWCAEHKAL